MARWLARLLEIAVVLSVLACLAVVGYRITHPSKSDSEPAITAASSTTAQELDQLAVNLSARHGMVNPSIVEWVPTTDDQAIGVFGDSNGSTTPVYLVIVPNGSFEFGTATGLARGSTLDFVATQAGFQILSLGVSNAQPDLSALGPVTENSVASLKRMSAGQFIATYHFRG